MLAPTAAFGYQETPTQNTNISTQVLSWESRCGQASYAWQCLRQRAEIELNSRLCPPYSTPRCWCQQEKACHKTGCSKKPGLNEQLHCLNWRVSCSLQQTVCATITSTTTLCSLRTSLHWEGYPPSGTKLISALGNFASNIKTFRRSLIYSLLPRLSPGWLSLISQLSTISISDHLHVLSILIQAPPVHVQAVVTTMCSFLGGRSPALGCVCGALLTSTLLLACKNCIITANNCWLFISHGKADTNSTASHQWNPHLVIKLQITFLKGCTLKNTF